MSQKSHCRATFSEVRRSLPEALRHRESKRVTAQLKAHWASRAYTNLLAYYPHGPELSLLAFMKWWVSGSACRGASTPRSLFLPRMIAGSERGLAQMSCLPYHPHSMALSPDAHGILSPFMHSNGFPDKNSYLDPPRACLILAPLLAFDDAGTRLGHGGGHYDQMLARLDLVAGGSIANRLKTPPPYYFIGIGYDQQYSSCLLPYESHDIRLDEALTPSQHFTFNHSIPYSASAQ